jgi:hypothetical protein
MRLTASLKKIKLLYNVSGLDYEIYFGKTKLLLEAYRDVCCQATDRAVEFYERLGYESKRLDVALDFLMDYAGDMEKSAFLQRVTSCFRTKWLVEIIDEALVLVRDYPDKGDIYYNLIFDLYASINRYKESDMLEFMDIDRSSYYERKKEAIALIGFYIWGIVVPKHMRKNYSGSEVNDVGYDFSGYDNNAVYQYSL